MATTFASTDPFKGTNTLSRPQTALQPPMVFKDNGQVVSAAGEQALKTLIQVEGGSAGLTGVNGKVANFAAASEEPTPREELKPQPSGVAQLQSLEAIAQRAGGDAAGDSGENGECFGPRIESTRPMLFMCTG